MNNQKIKSQEVKRTQSGFKIDFSSVLFDEESIKIRNKNICKMAASKKSASDFSDKCASQGFSIVPF